MAGTTGFGRSRVRIGRIALAVVAALGCLSLATALDAAGQSQLSTLTKSGSDPATNSTATSGGPAGTTAAGNTIDWVVDYRNTSGATADVNITDPITGNQSFVPGSLLTPPGLAPQWSTNGGSSYVTTEPGSGVNAVGATGTSVLGSTGAEAQASPPPPAAVPAAGAGDGFEALFIGANVYNVFHHRGGLSGVTPITVLDCHVRTTGAQCPGYPTYVSATAGTAFGTGPSTLVTAMFSQAAVSGNKIYYPVGVVGTRDDGVVCANVATQTSCGFTQLGSYSGGPANPNNGSGGTNNGGAVLGSRYYTASIDGEIYCFDLATETQCPGYAREFSDPTAPALRHYPFYSLQAWDDRYLFGNFARPAIGATPIQRDLICIDTTTNTRCPGFPKNNYGGTANSGNHDATLVPILNASGDVTGICAVSGANASEHPFKCFDLNGNSVATPFSETQTSSTGVNWVNFGSIAVVGSRLYFAESTSGGRATYTCWDYSVTPSAAGKIGDVCPGFTKATTNQDVRPYTIRQDPQNPECLWQLGDRNRFEVFSATFGGTSCNLGNAVVELTPEDFYCDGASDHVDGWDAITLGGITTADYNAVAVTITDENGDPVPGWQNTIVSNASQTIDISSIPYSGPTTSLRISVAISWGTHPVKPVTVRATFEGDPPQVCFQTTVGDAECAEAQDITNEANAITDAGTAGSDAPDGHDSGVVTFTQPADSSVCRTDLSVQKTGDALVDPGGAVSWTLTVTNHGPDDSTGSTVTDTIPDGFTNVAAPGCDVTGNQVTCDVGPLGLNDTQNFTITANAPDDTSACFDNDASVESAETDLVDSNNSDSVRTCTTPAADLELEKTGAAVVEPDGEVTWTLRVTNNGPDPSSGSTITDTVPGEVTNVTAPGCDTSAPPQITCDVGPLGPNEFETFEVTATAPSTASTCFENVASVAGEEADPVEENDEDTARSCTPAAADLELTKSAPATVDPEGLMSWTLTVHNNGPNPSTGSTVSDELPTGVTNISAPGCDVSGQTITCEVGPLAINGETEITITGNAPETPSFCFSNAALVVGDEGDRVTENDDASARTCTTPATDLELDKTATAVVDPEGQVTWELTVTNNGPDASTGGTVTDHLPGGITNISAPDCDVVDHTITCDVDPLAVDGTQTFTVTGDAPDLPSFCFQNQTSVAGFEGDPVTDNNDAAARTCTTPSADLALEKSAPAAVERGGQVTWTLTVTNLGPNESSGSTVTDTLPASITNVASSDCEVDGNLVSCEVGPLDVDGTASFEVTGTAPETSATCFENDGSVAGIEGDPVLANNTDSVETCTAPAADLALVKSAPATVAPNGQVTWTLTVTNNGPDASPSATVSDTLPVEISNVATETPGCTVLDNAVECALGPMPAAGTAEITITGDAPSTFSTCFDNAASVLGTEDDLELANNTDSVETCTTPAPPSGKPKLKVSKRASTDEARPGEVISYRIVVRNKGKADARRVRVCDKLPTGLKVLSAPGADTQSKKKVCWKLKALKAGGKRKFKVVAQIALNAKAGGMKNKAIVDGRNARRNRDAAEVDIQPVGGPCPSFGAKLRRC